MIRKCAVILGKIFGKKCRNILTFKCLRWMRKFRATSGVQGDVGKRIKKI
jgi:hypothetical protein